MENLVGYVAEVEPEPVVGGEPDIVSGRDHHIRDHTGLQAAQPVYPAVRAAGSSRFAEIRPTVLSTPSTTSAYTSS